MIRSDADLAGSVRNISIEKAQILHSDSNYVEMPRILSQRINYNFEGRKLDMLLYIEGGILAAKGIYTYDASGELTEVTEYKSDGSLLNRKVYMPTPNRKGIEEIEYNNSAVVSYNKTIHTFNDNGKQLGLETFDADNISLTKVNMSYDDMGRIYEVVMCISIKEGMIVQGGGGKAIVLSDNIKNKMQGIFPCFDKLLTSRTVFTYDDAGHLIETATYTHDNSLVGREAYVYEFDSRGNWIKLITSRWSLTANKFEPTEIMYRTITYY